MVALATICCLRVAELAALQVCDLWFDFHTGYGIPGFHGTAAVHIGRRKNDIERKGHHPAIGRAIDPALDLVHQLRAWLGLNDLAVSDQCTKQAFTAARCPHCAPLFSRLDNTTYFICAVKVHQMCGVLFSSCTHSTTFERVPQYSSTSQRARPQSRRPPCWAGSHNWRT